MRHRSYRQLRGLTVVEVLIGMVVTLAVTGIIFYTANSVVHASTQSTVAYEARADVENALDQMIAGANSAVAIYTTCAGSSTNPHGSGKSCANVRFKGVDSSGNVKYWGYDYNSTTDTLTPCVSYASAFASTCATPGRAVSNVSTFTATPTLASTLSIPFLSGYTVADHNYEVGSTTEDSNCTGNYSGDTKCRIVAGNRVMVITLANAYVPRSVTLIQGGAPYATSVVTNSYNPAQIGGLSLNYPSPLWFWGLSAASQTVDADEPNYGSYEGYGYVPSPWWSAQGANCASAAWQTTSQPSDDATFVIAPLAVGTCGGSAFNIASQDQNAKNLGDSIPTFIAGSLMPGTINGTTFNVLNPATLALGIGSTVTVAAGKTYDADNPDMVQSGTGGSGGVVADGDDLGNLGVSGCGGVAPGQQSSWTIVPDGATPNPNYGYASEILTGAKPGNCTLTFSNSVTNESTSIAITITPSPSPTPGGTPTPSPPPPAQTWPSAVMFPVVGSQLANAEGSSVCGADQPRIFNGSQMKSVDKNDTDPFGLGFTTDSNGCLISPNGSKVNQTHTDNTGRSTFVDEPGYGGTFFVKSNSCGNYISQNGWIPASGSGPLAALLLEASAIVESPCSFAVTDSSHVVYQNGSNTVWGEVGGNCATSGSTIYVGVGESCPGVNPGGDDIPCTYSKNEGGQLGSWDEYAASFSPGGWYDTKSPEGTINPDVPSGKDGTPGNWAFNRTAPGSVTIYIVDEHEQDILKNQSCSPSYSWHTVASYTMN